MEVLKRAEKGRGLGRGLEALLSSDSGFDETQEVTQLEVDEIVLRKETTA